MEKNILLEKINEIFSKHMNYSDFKLSLQQEDKNCWVITLSQMYRYVDVEFEHLLKLSELFNTKKINIGDKWHTEGCETCDYGSKYSLSIYILKSQLNIE